MFADFLSGFTSLLKYFSDGYTIFPSKSLTFLAGLGLYALLNKGGCMPSSNSFNLCFVLFIIADVFVMALSNFFTSKSFNIVVSTVLSLSF